MSEKLKITDLRETLANAEAELVTLVKRVEMLKEWIAVTKKLCSKGSRSTGSIDPPPIITRRTKTTELAKQIFEVLEEKGAPLHVKDIVAALAKKGHPMTARNPEATVAVALSRRPSEFLKTAPNTFGLAPKTAEPREATIAS